MSYSLIENQERYRNCFCNKNSGNDVVKLLEFVHEKTGTTHALQPEILIMVKGSAYFTMEGLGIGRRLKKGEFIFVPAGTRLSCEISRDSTILLVRITEELPECPVFRMDKTKENLTRYRDTDSIYALTANRRIRNFVSEFMVTLGDGFLCRHFLQGEANRLMFLLNAYYSEEERVKFFSHILTPDMRFSEFVRINHMKYKTISEMSDALCMTPQAFSNRFKKVFGMTPHKWMNQEKARQIYLDVCRSDMPLKEIAIKYDFPLSSNFFRFCKQTFGESPGNIRKCLHKGISDNS